jgi:HAMP domain-containing protein
MRLTILYASLFLVSGTCVLALVYVVSAGSSTIAIASPSPVGLTHAITTPGGLGGLLPAPRIHIQLSPGILSGALVARQHSVDLRRLLAISGLALAVTTVASALFGWIAAGRVLRPLRTITTTARTISAGNLHERLALAGPRRRVQAARRHAR